MLAQLLSYRRRDSAVKCVLTVPLSQHGPLDELGKVLQVLGRSVGVPLLEAHAPHVVAVPSQYGVVQRLTVAQVDHLGPRRLGDGFEDDLERPADVVAGRGGCVADPSERQC